MHKQATLGSVLLGGGRLAQGLGGLAAGTGRFLVENPRAARFITGGALGALGAGEGNRTRGMLAGGAAGLALPHIGAAASRMPEVQKMLSARPVSTAIMNKVIPVAAPVLAGSLAASPEKSGAMSPMRPMRPMPVPGAMPAATAKPPVAPTPAPVMQPQAPAAAAAAPAAGGAAGMTGPVNTAAPAPRMPAAPATPAAPAAQPAAPRATRAKRASDSSMRRAKLLIVKHAYLAKLNPAKS
jgi:hypothetical protein